MPAPGAWRGTRPSEGAAGGRKALLSPAGEHQAWSLMAPVVELQGLPKDLGLSLVFLWGWKSEPILCLFHLGIKRKPGSLQLTSSFQVIILN